MAFQVFVQPEKSISVTIWRRNPYWRKCPFVSPSLIRICNPDVLIKRILNPPAPTVGIANPDQQSEIKHPLCPFVPPFAHLGGFFFYHKAT